ncbi:hypothetical protein HYH02_000529 [Chlamydomonas schloesseri]|uniref:Uncharacterized protein n=1 Tax=Chlamydomonas schloesseri TaxID=2026947 RepID=A0A835WW04_9CHLO|nr:hypothetical protein HYH02_000529 [Chlamydomonas schloesseri]|eukprot:KAG2454691.1 hypothetical protein HYH02_000529 [Chlamydomonas schloesseri]
MSRLMASQGMPVGLSLGAAAPAAGGKGAAAAGGKGGRAGGGGGADAHDDDGGEDVTRPPPAAPGYDMEALSDMLRATAASARQQQPAASAGSSSSSAGDEGGFMAGVQQLGRSPLDDAWGTTRESPADIARRIVESNTAGGQVPDLDALARAADAELAADGAAPASAAEEEEEEEDDDDSTMRLSPSEEKYKSLEAMSADIKKLDEVFEVLASVPWLSEDVLAEKELRGVAQVGLLGTLEEVGFNIRHQLERIWAGERGADLAAGPGLQFRDQAALMAILYHTQQIEDAHGAPEAGYLPPPPPLPEGAVQDGPAGAGAGAASGLPDAGAVLEMLARKEKK